MLSLHLFLRLPLTRFFKLMKRSWVPPPHGLVQCVQLVQGCILQPTDRTLSTPHSRSSFTMMVQQLQPTLVILNNHIGTCFTMSPLSSPSSFLLFSFGSALSDFAFLPLNGFWARVTPKLWLQLDHAGPDCVAFPAGLVALVPLRPIRDHAVDGWIGTKQTNVCDTAYLA